MVQLVDEKTIGEAWTKSISTVLHHGEIHFDEDVSMLEIRQGLAITVRCPDPEDTLIETWGDASVISRMLKKFSRGAKMSDRPFTYGQLIYDKNGIDQFEWLVNRIRSKPETKSATISLLSEGYNHINLPCLVTLDAKLRNDSLDLHFMFRSQNIYGRQYANLLALVALQSNLARELSCAIGLMSGYISSPHIYDYDIKDAEKLIGGSYFKNVDRFYSHGPKSIRGGYK